MAWNGSGTFSRIVTTVSPAVGDTTIDAADQNSFTADQTAGINACLAKNGENAATGDLDLGSKKITLMADGTAATDAATKGQIDGITTVSVNNADGSANVSSTLLTLNTAIVESAIESVGPTGAGSDNTWTALDSVSAGADWVELRVYGFMQATGTALSIKVWARETGTSAEMAATSAAIFFSQIVDGDTDVKQIASIVTTKVPIDANGSFDLKWGTVGGGSVSETITATLVGYGSNG